MGATGTGPDGGLADAAVDVAPLDQAAADDLARAALALARAAEAGATLWCLAPEWPEHARHVTVEFVHPVVVGARALPAVTVSGAEPMTTLRTTARPGDVLVLVAPSTSAVADEAVQRSPAWGLTTIWIGAGRRPSAGVDHLVWIDAPDGSSARHDGRLVLRYHLLWELTHVCLEHPGLVARRAGAGDDDCDDGTCVTCRDEGRPGEVAEVLADGLVSVRTARGVETIDATLVGEVAAGDLLLVHAGTAIERWAAARG